MCQDTDLEEAGDNNFEDVESEHDELLLESAGDVIPKFAAAITPDNFALYFPNILQLMVLRTVRIPNLKVLFYLLGNYFQKKQHSVSQRSFAYGTLAECMKSLGSYVESFVPVLLNVWLTGAKDSAEEVRNNSIFGLGEMILHGKEKCFRLEFSFC